MKIKYSSEIDNILKVGHDLSESGINNWALIKKDALDAVDQFEKLQIPILGGDVCELKDNLIQNNYVSWHSDLKQDESKEDFVLRSIKETKEYIQNYPKSDLETTFFVLVPKV